jgi:pimeloyl-ACP methyl ester carboxylesterase
VGAQIVLEMYRQYPERVLALATLFGPAGKALESTRLPVSGKLLEQLASSAHAKQVVALLTRVAGLRFPAAVTGLLRQAHLIGARTSDTDLREVLDHMAQLDAATTPVMALSAQRHSAYDLLPAIQVPLLIMAGGRDPFMPVTSVAVPMHQAAPGSELVVLENATHAALLDFPEQITQHVDDFLVRRLALTPPSSASPPGANRRA